MLFQLNTHFVVLTLGVNYGSDNDLAASHYCGLKLTSNHKIRTLICTGVYYYLSVRTYFLIYKQIIKELVS